MWPVLLCAVAAAVIVAWRLVDLSVKLGRAHALLERVDLLVARRMIAEALAAARAASDPAARVLAHGLARRSAGPRRVAQAFHNAELVEVTQLERGFVALATIATVAPLLGALSTVLTLIRDGSGTSFPAAPLVTGILVALAASVLHLWLSSRVSRFGAELGRATKAAAQAIAQLDPKP